jgi:serine/threonine protein phosphatase PrpC
MFTLMRAFNKSARRRHLNIKAACAITTAVACTYAATAQDSTNVADNLSLGVPRLFALPVGANVVNASQKEKQKVSIHAARGPRATMEDRWYISEDMRFFAVYDGHGGYRVAEQAQKFLYDEFLQHLSEVSSAGSTSEEENQPHDVLIRTANDPESIRKALAKGFEVVSRKVLSTTYLDLEGSTAVVVYLCDNNIVTANLGDSRAILCRGSKAVPLTVDHKPDSPREKKRIEDLGGRVKWHGYLGPDKLPVPGMGAYRINGNLAVSRALGDRLERPFVSSDPDIAILDRNKDEDRFMVIASDGLWDVMTSQDVVDFVKQIMAGSPSSTLPQNPRGKKSNAIVPMEVPTSLLQQGMATLTHKGNDASIRTEMDKRKDGMAQFIVEEALRRGSADNVTVLVVWLR